VLSGKTTKNDMCFLYGNKDLIILLSRASASIVLSLFCGINWLLIIQKIKINAHKNGLVVVTKNEIQSLAVGQDRKNGINNLIKSIRKDLECSTPRLMSVLSLTIWHIFLTLIVNDLGTMYASSEILK
jgi:hypothetical protein